MSEIPHIRLDVLKEGLLIETINLNNRNIFKFGRGDQMNPTDTIQLLHESISLFHAALAIDKDQGLVMIDLGSETGTCLNGKRLEKNIPTPVQQQGDMITFGFSTRKYKVTVDYTRMLEAQEQALKMLE